MLASALFALLPALALGTPIQKRYTNQVIQSYRTGTCLTLGPGVQPYDGAPLSVGDCSTATQWDISPGSGSVVVSGTNYALDAGSDPMNFVGAKVWTSYPGLAQQTWYLTGDNRIAITGGTQCLDEGDNGPQTYTCTTGDTNQVWNVMAPGSSMPSSMPSMMPSSTMMASSTAMPSSTPTASSTMSVLPPGSTAYPDTPQPIVWTGGKCLTVLDGNGYDGSIVDVENCQSGLSSQQFYYRSDGSIQWTGGNYCLDAGSNPSSGTVMKLWQCYSGLPQQTWTYVGTVQALLQTANNQCLDVDNADDTTLQTWTCSAPDPQQQFELDGYQYLSK